MSEPRQNILVDYIKLNQGTEIPPQFAMWCGLAGISAVLGRRIWLDMGVFTVFPNLYVLLVASSGKCRKSTSIMVLDKLLRRVQPTPNIIAQKCTPEALIDALKVQEISIHGQTKQFVKELCEGFVISDELSVFLNRKTYEAGLAALLIKVFDCVEVMDYRTKARGVEMIRNPCMGMLAGSTVDKIREAIPAEAVGEGLTSRILFIYVDTPMPPVPRPRPSPERKELEDKVLRALQSLQTWSGEVTLTDPAWTAYERAYVSFYETTRFYDSPALSGYASRRFIHVLKLAVLLRIAELEDLVVDTRHLEGAIKLVEGLERSLPRVMELILASDKGTTLDQIWRVILSARGGGISRSELLGRFIHRVDSRELADVIDTLRASGRVKMIVNGNSVSYHAVV